MAGAKTFREIIEDQEKIAKATTFAQVLKFNPYHDSLGRFTTASGAASFTFRTKDPAKQSLADRAAAREKERTKNMGGAASSKNNVLGWKEISGEHTADDDITAANPNYKKGYEYRVNCQRCVPTYEMRRRGYDVEAKPAILDSRGRHNNDAPAKEWQNVFKGGKFESCSSGSGKNQIDKKMAEWGDGARAEVYVVWKGRGKTSAHVFVAERRNGKTIYTDPQTGNLDASGYFSSARTGRTMIKRMDNLEPNWSIMNDYCMSK